MEQNPPVNNVADQKVEDVKPPPVQLADGKQEQKGTAVAPPNEPKKDERHEGDQGNGEQVPDLKEVAVWNIPGQDPIPPRGKMDDSPKQAQQAEKAKDGIKEQEIDVKPAEAENRDKQADLKASRQLEKPTEGQKSERSEQPAGAVDSRIPEKIALQAGKKQNPSSSATQGAEHNPQQSEGTPVHGTDPAEAKKDGIPQLQEKPGGSPRVAQPDEKSGHNTGRDHDKGKEAEQSPKFGQKPGEGIVSETSPQGNKTHSKGEEAVIATGLGNVVPGKAELGEDTPEALAGQAEVAPKKVEGEHVTPTAEAVKGGGTPSAMGHQHLERENTGAERDVREEETESDALYKLLGTVVTQKAEDDMSAQEMIRYLMNRLASAEV